MTKCYTGRLVELEKMGILNLTLIFFTIILGVMCIVFGMKEEKRAGVVVLLMVFIDIAMFRFFIDGLFEKDVAKLISDVVRFVAFLGISIESSKIWPTLCAGVLLTMVSASTLNVFDVAIGIFGSEGVWITCHLIVCIAISTGLWRSITARQ